MDTNVKSAAAAQPRSTLIFLSILICCLTSAFLTASIVLIYQYKLGIPFSMTVSLLIAIAFALLIPLLFTVLFTAWNKNTAYGPYIVFLTTNILISITLGILIF